VQNLDGKKYFETNAPSREQSSENLQREGSSDNSGFQGAEENNYDDPLRLVVVLKEGRILFFSLPHLSLLCEETQFLKNRTQLFPSFPFLLPLFFPLNHLLPYCSQLTITPLGRASLFSNKTDFQRHYFGYEGSRFQFCFHSLLLLLLLLL